jgi:nucleoside triphosphate pyrophosphatase
VSAPERVVLASRSPQRRSLLRALGVEFRVVPSEVEEASEGDPREVVLGNALAKARAVAARRREGTLVIAGDTEVVIDGRPLGQSVVEGEARWCLETLSGRSHEVLGGLALLGPDRPGGVPSERIGVASTTVTFARLERSLIDAYLSSGEWRGRAGAYAVQGLGSALVERIDGDVSNVIGLPIGLLLRLCPELTPAPEAP